MRLPKVIFSFFAAALASASVFWMIFTGVVPPPTTAIGHAVCELKQSYYGKHLSKYAEQVLAKIAKPCLIFKEVSMGNVSGGASPNTSRESMSSEGYLHYPIDPGGDNAPLGLIEIALLFVLSTWLIQKAISQLFWGPTRSGG